MFSRNPSQPLGSSLMGPKKSIPVESTDAVTCGEGMTGKTQRQRCAVYLIVKDDRGVEEEKRGEYDDEHAEFVLVLRRRRLWRRVHLSSSAEDKCGIDSFRASLDPAPGLVLDVGESWDDGAKRVASESLGIDAVVFSMADREDGGGGGVRGRNDWDRHCPNNILRRLFCFHHEYDGEKLYCATYELSIVGRSQGIAFQKETDKDDDKCSVEVLRMSVDETMKCIGDTASEDGNGNGDTSVANHAFLLYMQHRGDKRLNRRSSSGLDAYRLRPKPRAIFFDCDDCLYFDSWKVANCLTSKIDDWCTTHAGLPEGEAYSLYKRHGTALRGLLAEGHLKRTDEAVDAYLRDVHDLPISEMLTRDDALRNMIARMDPTVPRYVFTASVRHHAERCLDALGIRDLFVDIVDTKACNLATKHSREAFEVAMKVAGVDDPECCVLLDDSVKNIRTASEMMGWRTVLVGRVGRDCGRTVSSEFAESEIDRIHDFPAVFPELFEHYS